MTLYRYKALNTRGETLDGTMEAGSEAEVALRLQEQGHLPVEARPASEARAVDDWKTLFKPKPFSGQRLVQFTQQLATLLGAGQPLDRALSILLGLPEDERSRRAITDLDPIEHAILLIAAAEFAGHPETNHRVIIDEAIELAKRYGADEGYKFVNGVLDRFAKRERAVEFTSRS